MSKSKQEARAAERAARLAELQKKQRAQERKRNLSIGAVVVLVLAVIGTGFFLISKQNDVDAVGAGKSEYGITIGRPDAPHEVVVYEDFLCPICGEFEAETSDKLAELADAGEVYVEYRPFALLTQYGDYSARAVAAFGVVRDTYGPEVAKKFHDLLYDPENQPAEDAEQFPDADALIKLAVEAGAEDAAVREGIEAGENTFSTEATKEADDAGVKGTPTVLLDGESFTKGPAALLEELS